MSFQKMCISPRNQHMSFRVLSEKAFYILLYLKKHTRHHAIPDSFFCRLSYSSIGFCRCHQRQAGCKPVQSVETHFQSGRNISSQKHALGRDIIISDTGTRIDHQEGSPRVITLCSDTNSDPVESQGLGSSISDFQRYLQSRRSFTCRILCLTRFFNFLQNTSFKKGKRKMYKTALFFEQCSIPFPLFLSIPECLQESNPTDSLPRSAGLPEKKHIYYGYSRYRLPNSLPKIQISDLSSVTCLCFLPHLPHITRHFHNIRNFCKHER